MVYPRWSFAYPNADFTQATVTMTQDNQPITTTQATAETGSGDNTLVWRTAVAAGGTQWPTPTTDTAYEVMIDNVLIDGAPHNFSYTVTVFDPMRPLVPPPTGVQQLYLPLILR
ncbi:MAG: hypothetical protein KDE47_27795 [Caldilineaceae bacterium]|nr:hypothetical protein [Caldilineaceae bacterium]